MATFDRYRTTVNLDRVIVGRAKITAPRIQARQTHAWFDAWYEGIERRGAFIPAARRQAIRKRIVYQAGRSSLRDCLDLAEALSTDKTDVVLDHIAESLDNAGNVFANFEGPPGGGKTTSSLWLGCDAGLYDGYIKTRSDLELRVFIEAFEADRIFPLLERRDVAFKDENPRSSGQGSATDLKNLLNKQDMLRATQKSLHMASPELEQRVTTQLSLTNVARTKNAHFDATGKGETCFLVESEGELIGHAWLPWCSGQIHAWYVPIKAAVMAASEGGGKSGDRSTGWVERVLEQSPHLLRHLRGQNLTECTHAAALILGRFNVEQATSNQVGRIIKKLVDLVEEENALPEDIVKLFENVYGIRLGDHAVAAVENLYAGEP